MDTTLAIDFGTSNSVVFVYKQSKFEPLVSETGSFLFPSYVAYMNGSAITGDSAKGLMGKPNRFVVGCVKRLIGQPYSYYKQLEHKDIFGCEVVCDEDGYPAFVIDDQGTRVSCVDVASELFKHFKQRAEKYCDPNKYDSVYLTVPADYSEAQCSKIKEAARRAGLTVKKLIAEPTAAALSWFFSGECTVQNYENILVYDFGGGTFDISLLTYTQNDGFTILDKGGDPCLGGNDLDVALGEYVKKQYKQQTGEELIRNTKRKLRQENLLKEKCEEVKIALSTVPAMDFDLSSFSDEDVSIPITRVTFSLVINSLIDKTFECVQTVLDRNRLQYSNIRYFFTIGGSSRIQLISEKIQRLFQNCVFPPVDRQNCVALGAAKMLQADLTLTKMTVREVMATSYGIGLGDGKVLILLRKGSKLPLTGRSFVFQTTTDMQREVKMKVFKCKLDGNASRELEIVDETACHYIYDLHFALSERKPEGEVFVEIEFSMDVGGVLMVKCYDPTNHRRVIYSHEYEAVYGSYSIVCNKQTNNISVSLEHYNEPTLLEVAGAEQEMTPLASLFSNTKQASQILSKSSDTLYPDFAEVSI